MTEILRLCDNDKNSDTAGPMNDSVTDQAAIDAWFNSPG